MGLVFCGLAFVLALVCTWRSTVAGLGAVLASGYGFGILRANYLDSYSHFLFDSAVLGLYLSFFAANWPRPQSLAEHSLQRWLALLLAWVGIMFLIPIQHPLIQLVGLRGNAFLLPCALIGARLSDRQGSDLAVILALLNLLAFGFAGAEFVLGVERFYPENPVTEIIYNSKDLAGNTAHRIPACFSNAHSFAGTMVMTLPWLVGAWVQPQTATWRRWLLAVGMSAALVGVFMTGTRVFLAQLFLLVAVVTVLLMMTPSGRNVGALWFSWALMLVGIGYLVSSEERLQRFITLQNTDEVLGRIEGSVNMSFLDLLTTYPLGNGLGGGGTSIPFFLQHLIKDPVLIENEYGRILLEQGVVGLAIWLAFAVWVLARPAPAAGSRWSLGWRLLWFVCLINLVLAVLGTGLMTAIPQTCVFFLSLGFIAVPRLAPVPRFVRLKPEQGPRGETPTPVAR